MHIHVIYSSFYLILSAISLGDQFSRLPSPSKQQCNGGQGTPLRSNVRAEQENGEVEIFSASENSVSIINKTKSKTPGVVES